MRVQFTPAQVAMLVERADRQLSQIIDDSLKEQVGTRHIARSCHFALHETVVSLTRLFREQVAGAQGVATLITKEYAKGVDPQSRMATLACVRSIQLIVRGARDQYLSSAA